MDFQGRLCPCASAEYALKRVLKQQAGPQLQGQHKCVRIDSNSELAYPVHAGLANAPSHYVIKQHLDALQ